MISLNPTLRTARLALVLAALDAGAGPATLAIYTGPKPATGAAITTATLLGTVIFSAPAGTITDAVLNFAAISEDPSADATGTAAWCRISDQSLNFVLDGDVGLVGSGAFLELNTLSILAGGPISIGTTRAISEGDA